MFKDTKEGETQYCPICEERAKKCNELQKENEHLKDFIQDLDAFCHEFQIALGQTDMLCVEMINRMSNIILKYPFTTRADIYRNALEEVKAISNNLNFTVSKRRELISKKINEVLK